MIELLLFIAILLVIILAITIYELHDVKAAYNAQSDLVGAQKECIAIMADKLGCKDILPKEYFQ